VPLHDLVADGRADQIAALPPGRAAGAVRHDEALTELVRTQKITHEVARQAADVPSEIDAAVRAASGAHARKA
jgi:Tfp pilus assembly pilus retraction ATPase PilT